MKDLKAALDVHYRGDLYTASCVIFSGWEDAGPLEVVTTEGRGVRPYRPGFFYERELPCLLDVLGKASRHLETIVLDGYVHLAEPHRKGLGMFLYESLGGRSTVVGVAKNPLSIAERFVEVMRGTSSRPLYVSCAGCTLEEACSWIQNMHGAHRIPTLLKIAHARAAG